MKLASRINQISPSETLKIASLAKEMKARGEPVISFAAGELDFDTPSYIKESAINAINTGFTKYTPSSGTKELREAVCVKLKKDNGLDYNPSQVIISCGAKHAIYNALQVLCNKDDEVIIPSPCWLSYPEMVRLTEATPVIIDTQEENNFRLKVEELERHITKKTKAIIINSPSNPTGMMYSKEELKKLAEVIVKYKIFVISDEIYEKITFDKKHVSIASLGKDIFDLSIVINGASKSHSMTGWRIGYSTSNLEIAEAIDRLQSQATSNPTSISQKAALAALTGSDDFIKEVNIQLRKRRDFMVKGINSIPELSCFNPDGAFYVFSSISRTGLNSGDFANQFLEKEKVAVIPGKPFGSDRHVRFSFATSYGHIVEGIDRLREFVTSINR
jgi:aspartate aminotransferase